MSEPTNIKYKQLEKYAKDLSVFLIELDSVCDILYNRMEYDGVFDVLMTLEDVRVRYYIEYFDINATLNKNQGK